MEDGSMTELSLNYCSDDTCSNVDSTTYCTNSYLFETDGSSCYNIDGGSAVLVCDDDSSFQIDGTSSISASVLYIVVLFIFCAI